MKHMAKEFVDQKLREYRNHYENNEHDETVGLTLVGVALLRAGIELGNRPTIYALQAAIESALQPIIERRASRESTDTLGASSGNQTQHRDLRATFDAIIGLFATAENLWPNRLNSLALKILDLGDTDLQSDCEAVKAIVNQRIEEARSPSYPHNREERLTETSNALVYFLDVLRWKARDCSLVSLLREIASMSLGAETENAIRRSGLTWYSEAMGYLDAGTIGR